MGTQKELIDAMVAGEVLDGFYFNLSRKEYFCKTNYKIKSKVLAKKILRALSLPENPDTVAEIIYLMIPAKCEIKRTGCGRYYYNIFGRNISGLGSDNIEDSKTIVFEV